MRQATAFYGARTWAEGMANYRYLTELAQPTRMEQLAMRAGNYAEWLRSTYPVTVAAPAETLPAPPTPGYPNYSRYRSMSYPSMSFGDSGGASREPSWVQQLTTWRGVLA